MSLKSRILNILKRFSGLTSALTSGQNRVSDVRKPPRTSSGGRPRKDVDVDAVMRLHRLGWSDNRIARHLGISPHTVADRIAEWKPSVAPMRKPAGVTIPPAAPPIAPVQRPVTAYKPPLPVAPKPTPVPVPVVPAPEPYGLGDIPAGCKAFFLVQGKLNQEYMHNCAQLAIGIEQWHPTEYAMLAAFRDVEKIWIVINSNEDNRLFLMSIVNDLAIRERCLISVDNGATLCTQPVRFGRFWVQHVAKAKLLRDRPHDGSRPEADMSIFEAIHNFQPIPLPSHKDKLDALLKSPKTEPEDRLSTIGGSVDGEDWHWRWSGAR